ncbi:Protein cappuccino like protein [Trachymyrmex septentrionalis]|uniref:Protein cappuccino like protein n=1 Tax=Trachymyrmex septentrionalis TaxID=34720 RepID=A0A195FLM8_9HYME|nr:Protein cappuccino like protein [Trachymyrmex septentrionalis]
MTSSQTTELTEELVKDYANYAKVDWSNQMKNVRDVIEDTLIRLEEFQSIVAMVENSSAECMQQHLPKLQQMKDGMAILRNRIDALEHIVAMANMNLSTLEAAVDKAEADLGVSDRLFGILNPLSFFQLELPVRFSALIVRPPWTRIYLERCIYLSTCEEATEVETHHQQTAATTMGVAEDETPSSLTSSHPNTNNPNQEEWSKLLLARSSRIQTGPLSYVTSKETFPQLAVVNVLKSKTIVWKFKSYSSLPSVEARDLYEESNVADKLDLVANIEDTIKVDNVEYESHFDLGEPGRKGSRYCMAFHPSSDYSLEDKTKNRKVNMLELKTLDLHSCIFFGYGYTDYYVPENIFYERFDVCRQTEQDDRRRSSEIKKRLRPFHAFR